jgi:hypothetical protein
LELTQSAVDKFVSQAPDWLTFTIDDENGNLTVCVGLKGTGDEANLMKERSRALIEGKVIIEGNLRSWREWDIDVDFDKIKSADCYYWRGGNKVRGTLSLRTLNTDTKELTSTPLKKTYRLWENAWD